MIDEGEARRRILEATPANGSGVESVSLTDSLGRLAGENVSARVDLPGFDNSSMDGYAVRAADAASKGASLKVTGLQPAGEDLQLRLNPGEAIRIFTGAPIPEGADAVVMQEDVSLTGDSIAIVEGVVPAENIRPRGGDVCIGQRIVSAGERLTPSRIGLLASQGYAETAIHRAPSVGIVTTGDELIDPIRGAEAAPLKPGQIFNSNGPMLEALTRQFGGDPKSFHAGDESTALHQTLVSALDTSQFVLIAGGVSVGERDLVKDELARVGVESDFWRVKVKPGKPFLFGRRTGERPVLVFGLPGNPVSAFVTFLLFAAPALAKFQGRCDFSPGELPLEKVRRPVAERLTNPGDRPHYIRLKIDSNGAFRPTGLQQSHALFGLARAGALLRLEPEQVLEAGSEAEGYLL